MIKTILFIFLPGALILAGFAGIFLPFLPGLPFAWLGLALYAFLTSFEEISLFFLGITLALTIISGVIDYAAPIWGSKRYEASRYGLLGAVLGLIFGFLVLGPVGVLIGPFGGVLLAELLSGKALSKALSAATGTFVGIFFSFLLRITVVFLILGGFLMAVIF